MRVIIAGSRTITTSFVVEDAIRLSGFTITEVVSGKEPRGVDRLGEEWASRNGIPVRLFPADWDTLGLAAGPARNRQMAAYAGALIAVWDGKSRGTANMLLEARKRKLLTYVHQPWSE